MHQPATTCATCHGKFGPNPAADSGRRQAPAHRPRPSRWPGRRSGAGHPPADVLLLGLPLGLALGLLLRAGHLEDTEQHQPDRHAREVHPETVPEAAARVWGAIGGATGSGVWAVGIHGRSYCPARRDFDRPWAEACPAFRFFLRPFCDPPLIARSISLRRIMIAPRPRRPRRLSSLWARFSISSLHLAHLVAQRRRPLELHLFGRLEHLALELGHQVLGAIIGSSVSTASRARLAP